MRAGLERERGRRKVFLGYDVLTAARARIDWIFANFSRLYLAFSGGKDSSVLFHLCAAEARRRGRRFGLLFIDWECQYQYTIRHVEEMVEKYADVIELFWCCIPLKTVNSVSVFEPEWIAWEPGKEWIREKPEKAICEGSFFPFYRENMTFEEFVPAFGQWYAGNIPTACFVGIRAEESLNRWVSVAGSNFKRTYCHRRWTTRCSRVLCNAYPLYDWRTEDIWTYCGRYGMEYNHLYDRLFQAGLPLRMMRICEPFGNEQRRSLDLYQVIEPETWGRLVARVNGANFGSLYAREHGLVLGNRRIAKPEHRTWEEFARMLLASMPEATATHYRNKIAVYLHWWLTTGGLEKVPDEQPGDQQSRDVPSWRRICRCLLKNDYWCRTLCFAPTRTEHYRKYCELMARRREQWKLI